MLRSALRLMVEWNRSELSEWSSKLLLTDNEALSEIIREQVDSMRDEIKIYQQELDQFIEDQGAA